MKRKKIAFVQPVLSPYSIPRFEELAKDNSIEIFLFIESDCFTHRPGWGIRDVRGCRVELIRSLIKKEDVENTDRGYIIEGIRAIPYGLPFLIAKYHPDIVIVCNATELFFAGILKPFLNYKIGLIVEDTHYSLEHTNRLKKKIKKISYRKADFYLPFSIESVNYLKQIGISENIYQMSWSFEPLYFQEIPDHKRIENVKRKFNIAEKLTFIFVGMLIPLKGIENLLIAWNNLPYEVKEKIALIIVGEGSQQKQLSDYVKRNNIPNIIITGKVSYEEMNLYYRTADIFILPTLKDLFSLVVLEAMSCGLPILTSVYNGAKELVEEGGNGYLFDSANIEAIQHLILKIYNEKQLLKNMGKVSSDIIKAYSTRNVMNRLKNILQSL